MVEGKRESEGEGGGETFTNLGSVLCYRNQHSFIPKNPLTVTGMKLIQTLFAQARE